MKLLPIVIVGLAIALLGIAACKRGSKIPTADANADSDLKLASVIELKRIHSGCIDCDDHSITLHRGAGNLFADAAVIRTDLHTNKQREGKLSAYYYNHLIELVKSQGVLEMNDEYATGWFDSLIVTMRVSIGDRKKTIRTSNEGEVPVPLWGIYMAVDGAVAYTKWNDAK
jgi:hypothetical protein